MHYQTLVVALFSHPRSHLLGVSLLCPPRPATICPCRPMPFSVRQGRPPLTLLPCHKPLQSPLVSVPVWFCSIQPLQSVHLFFRPAPGVSVCYRQGVPQCWPPRLPRSPLSLAPCPLTLRPSRRSLCPVPNRRMPLQDHSQLSAAQLSHLIDPLSVRTYRCLALAYFQVPFFYFPPLWQGPLHAPPPGFAPHGSRNPAKPRNSSAIRLVPPALFCQLP